MAFTPSKNEKRQNSACNNGTILAFFENQRQSTFHSRRKAPFLPPKTARTAGRSGRAGAEKRQSFLLLPCRLRLLPPPKPARRRSSSALAVPATLPHGGAASGFRASGGYALGCAVKAAQTADTGATARNALPVTAASPSRAVHTSFPCPPAGQEKRASVHLLKSLLPEMPALLRLPRPASRRPSSRP